MIISSSRTFSSWARLGSDITVVFVIDLGSSIELVKARIQKSHVLLRASTDNDLFSNPIIHHCVPATILHFRLHP